MKRALRSVAVVLAIAVVAPHARADGPTTTPKASVDEGRARFQRGVTFYKDGDFRSALVEFQEAYRIAPNYRLLFNIGKTNEELRDFAAAVVALRQYLAEGGSEIGAARRKEVEADLKRLMGHVASLEVTVNEPDATLVAEGERRVDLGSSPRAQAVLLNSGAWTISAKKDGFTVAEEKVVLGGGDAKAVRLTLSPVVAPPPTPRVVPVVAPPPPVAPPPERSKAPVYVGGAVTITLAVGAGVTGALALHAKSDYDSALGRLGATPDDVSSARTHTRTFALATDVLGGAAIAGAIVTTILYFARSPATKTTAFVFDGVGAHGAF